MTLTELRGDKRQDILHIVARHGATNVRVFGSVARGEAGPGSGMDFLVDVGLDGAPSFRQACWLASNARRYTDWV